MAGRVTFNNPFPAGAVGSSDDASETVEVGGTEAPGEVESSSKLGEAGFETTADAFDGEPVVDYDAALGGDAGQGTKEAAESPPLGTFRASDLARWEGVPPADALESSDSEAAELGAADGASLAAGVGETEASSDSAAAVADAYEARLGQQGWNRMSGPFAYQDWSAFGVWAGADEEGAAPQFNYDTPMSCWESILLTAHEQGSLGWEEIHDVYWDGWIENFDPDTASEAKRAEQHVKEEAWAMALPEHLTRGGLTTLGPGGTLPERGDLVFFDGGAHVALAAGTVNQKGEPEVITWGFGDRGDLVQKKTIAELVTRFGNPPPRVTFGRPIWADE